MIIGLTAHITYVYRKYIRTVLLCTTYEIFLFHYTHTKLLFILLKAIKFRSISVLDVVAILKRAF